MSSGAHYLIFRSPPPCPMIPVYPQVQPVHVKLVDRHNDTSWPYECQCCLGIIALLYERSYVLIILGRSSHKPYSHVPNENSIHFVDNCIPCRVVYPNCQPHWPRSTKHYTCYTICEDVRPHIVDWRSYERCLFLSAVVMLFGGLEAGCHNPLFMQEYMMVYTISGLLYFYLKFIVAIAIRFHYFYWRAWKDCLELACCLLLLLVVVLVRTTYYYCIVGTTRSSKITGTVFVVVAVNL